MITKKEVHVGDIDTSFSFTVLDQDDDPIDLSQAEEINVYYATAAGTTGSWTATGDAQGVVTGTMDELVDAGPMEIQIHVVFEEGATPDEKWSNIDTLYVHPNITI